MWIGWLEFDLLLGDVHSLKQKRSVVRPVLVTRTLLSTRPALTRHSDSSTRSMPPDTGG